MSEQNQFTILAEPDVLDLRFTSPDNMVDMKYLKLDQSQVEQRERSKTCPEPKAKARFQRTESGLRNLTSPRSPRPGHYDPRAGYIKTPSPGHYDPRQGYEASKPRAMSAAKPAITHGQLVREAFICKTAQEMMKTFTSTVLDVRLGRNGRIMWTSVPEDLKYIFNVTDIKTVDSWKQTMHGNVQLDISMFKVGDKIKMSVQSIGVSNRHHNQPLIRGVPDYHVHPETLLASSGTTPRPPWEIRDAAEKAAAAVCAAACGTSVSSDSPTQRSRANTDTSQLFASPIDVKHRRFSVKKPSSAPRFCRSQTGTSTLSEANKKAFTTHSMLPRSRAQTTVSAEETDETQE